MELLYTDELNRPVYDVTQDLKDMKLLVLGKNIVKAERCENNMLILQNRAGGNWYIDYWCLKPNFAALNEITGNEVTLWKRREIDPKKSLFQQTRLF